MRQTIILWCSLASLIAAAAGETPRENGGRPELLSQRARWRTFPADVKSLRVDPKGRPWFEIEGYVPIADLKRQVEQASRLPAPWIKGARIIRLDRKGRIWLRPSTNVALLLGYDPAINQWIERQVEKQDGAAQLLFTESAHESKSGRLYFTDRFGVHVLDGDKWSYQPLYRINIDRKLYYDTLQAFDEPHFAENESGRVFAWTGWGRYGWTGTVGYFTHDADGWTHRFVPNSESKEPGRAKDTPDAPDPNRIASVIPLSRDRALVCTQSGPAIIVSLRERKLEPEARKQIEKDISLLGDKTFRIREGAFERLGKLGPAALPLLREGLKEYKDIEVVGRLNRLIATAEGELRGTEIDGHQLRYCRVHGYDGKGNAWLWYDRCRKADTPEERGGFKLVGYDGKVTAAPEGTRNWYPDSLFFGSKGRAYFARYRSGCVAFEGDHKLKVTSATQTSLRYVLGEDSEGRIYLSDERRIHAFHPDVEDARPVLHTTIYDVPWAENDVAQDSLGRTWAFLGVKGEQPGSPAMSVFEKGAWREVALPGNVAPENLHFSMPLKKGCFVVRDATRRALFFDGDTWHTYANLRQLVEQRHKQLAGLIDNRRWGRDFYAKIRVDADGRIWLVEWDEAAVWDGKRWLELAGVANIGKKASTKINFLMPLPGTKEMLAVLDISGAAFKISIDRGEARATRLPLPGNTKIDSDYTTRSGLWIDNQDRVWIPKDHNHCIRIDADGAREIPNTGFPRFADSKGCIWFHNPAQRKIVVLDPKGRRAELADDALGQEATGIAEDTPGSIWVTGERGLLNVQVTVTDAAVSLRRVEVFDRDVPRGQCLHLSIDREHNLWFYGPGADRSYRLYRVQLAR